ncbi:hypothetical protein HY971_04135 [Candidatus Kaiserbacteria bacterium]|nr:hypothetical protein [Candidatus Kaiserbacteria bacterium]
MSTKVDASSFDYSQIDVRVKTLGIPDSAIKAYLETVRKTLSGSELELTKVAVRYLCNRMEELKGYGIAIGPTVIVVTRRNNDIHACLEGHPEYFGCAASIDGAVGNLIRCHADGELNIKLVNA